MVPRVDVESVSLIWDLALDVPLVDEVLPQLAWTVIIAVSIIEFPETDDSHSQNPSLRLTHLFAPGTRHAMPHITVFRSISAIWRSLNSAKYAGGPLGVVE